MIQFEPAPIDQRHQYLVGIDYNAGASGLDSI
jgi:hypothetical protein